MCPSSSPTTRRSVPIEELAPRLKLKTMPVCHESADGPSSLLAAPTKQGLTLGRKQGLVELPFTPLPLPLAQQPVLAMALQGQLQYGRLGKAVAVDYMDTKT